MSELEHKPSREEDDWFAREDIEKKRALAFKQQKTTAVQEREALQKLHHMKCPNCGMDLHTVQNGKVAMETCFHCKGIFLKAGALAELADEEKHSAGTAMKSILNLFKRELGP